MEKVYWTDEYGISSFYVNGKRCGSISCIKTEGETKHLFSWEIGNATYSNYDLEVSTLDEAKEKAEVLISEECVKYIKTLSSEMSLYIERVNSLFEFRSNSCTSSTRKNEYVVKVTDEEMGEKYFVIIPPANTSREKVFSVLEMAAKYANMDLNLPVLKGIEKYDEHYGEMVRIRAGDSGPYTFMYYVELLHGWKIESYVPDTWSFEFTC